MTCFYFFFVVVVLASCIVLVYKFLQCFDFVLLFGLVAVRK